MACFLQLGITSDQPSQMKADTARSTFFCHSSQLKGAQRFNSPLTVARTTGRLPPHLHTNLILEMMSFEDEHGARNARETRYSCLLRKRLSVHKTTVYAVRFRIRTFRVPYSTASTQEAQTTVGQRRNLRTNSLFKQKQKESVKIETAPYFSFLCFSPTPENNKAIKTIKTKGRGCGETHTPRPVGEMWLYSNPPRIRKMEKRMGVGSGVQFPFCIACNHKT